jgi:hypothetical protein
MLLGGDGVSSVSDRSGRSVRQTLILQAPWFLVVAFVAVTNGLTGNGYSHLLGAGIVVAYGVMLITNFRGLAVRPPWRRPVTGRATGVFVFVIGLVLTVAAIVTIFR